MINKEEKKWKGIPESLLPAEHYADVAIDKYKIVTSGARNLQDRPFDYRNPWPLKTTSEIAKLIEIEQIAMPWAIEDEGEVYNYYLNDQAGIGVKDGPENAIIDLHGTMVGYTGALGFKHEGQLNAPDMRNRKLSYGPVPIIEGAVQSQYLQTLHQYYAMAAEEHRFSYPIGDEENYRWIGGAYPTVPAMLLYEACELEQQKPGDAAGAESSVVLSYTQKSALPLCAYYMYFPQYFAQIEQFSLQEIGNDVYKLIGQVNGVAYTLYQLKVYDAVVEICDEKLVHWYRSPGNAPKYDREFSLKIRAKANSVKQGRRLFEIIMPFYPLENAEDSFLQQLKFDEERNKCMKVWEQHRSKGLQISIPEQKVEDAFYQALNHLDLCSVRLEESVYPTPGPTGGHHLFYFRDSADMIYAYDLIGDIDRAEQMIEHYNLVESSQETCVMLLWLLGKHHEIARNRERSMRTFYLVKRCMAWLVNTWTKSQKANGGLLPVMNVADNELIKGHFVSYHLYAITGSKFAYQIAEAIGENKLASSWKAFHEMFREAVMLRMDEMVTQSDGIITPGFEGMDAEGVIMEHLTKDPEHPFEATGSFGGRGGADWHNVGAVFPTEVLSPHHPYVESSLVRWRQMYTEGIFPYPHMSDYARLHNYNTMNLSGTWLRRGDHAEAIRDLYGVLLHTSATHASGEVVDSTARYDFNCTPHNWFSGKLVRMIRDLLLYEDNEGGIHLLGGLSPAWMQPGMKVAVKDAPTLYGMLQYEVIFKENGFSLHIQRDPLDFNAQCYVLHLPPFLQGVKVVSGMQQFPVEQCRCKLGTEVSKLEASWDACKLPELSFATVVQSYLNDYKERAITAGVYW